MIPESFYEVSGTYKCGPTVDQFTDSFTTPVGNITDFMTDKVSAYWLGYISTENLPMAFRYSVGTHTEEEGFIFRDTTSDDNFPCGYCVGNRMPGTSFYGMPQYEVNVVYINDRSYANWNYNNISLFNSLHPEYSGYANYNTNNRPSFDFKCYIFDAGENYIQQYDTGYTFENYRQLFNLFNGEETITVNIIGHVVEISKEDLETGTCYKEAEDHYYIRMFLTDYRFNLGRVKNGTYEDPTVLPAFMVEPTFTDENGDEGSWLVFGNQGVSVGSGAVARILYGEIQWALDWWAQYGGGARAGLNGQITEEAYLALRNSPYTQWYVYHNNVLLTKNSNDYWFYCIFPIGEIQKHFSLMYRVDISDNGNTPSYVLGLTYATNVTENNEFLAGLKTGNITNQAFKDSLRPWQYSDIAVNEFTEDDVPPYEPEPRPGPTPQETEPKYPGFPTLGPSTRIVPTAGVNFYALNASSVTDFVQRLWSQPKSFYEAIQIAGNQTNSIFDYIQSFRYYPLMVDFATENVYPVIFGTGAVLKEADGDTNFQLSEASPIQRTVTAGEWNLNASIYHWRNNFLDYSPYLKMSIYLPFAGTIELSPEAVASHTDISAAKITLLTSFEIETGTITYYVVNQANVILAQKTAKIAIDLPLSGNNSAEQSAAILRAQFSTVKQLLGAGSSITSGAATSGVAGAAAGAVSALGSLGDMYLQNSLAQRAVPVEVQGMGGTLSALAAGQYPYITINRQKVSNPPNYAHTTGYLVEGTYKINTLNGLTVCRNVDVSGISQATDKEKAEIKKILESGFYA